MPTVIVDDIKVIVEDIKVSGIPEDSVLVIVEQETHENTEALEAMEAEWEMWDEYYHCCGSY